MKRIQHNDITAVMGPARARLAAALVALQTRKNDIDRVTTEAEARLVASIEAAPSELVRILDAVADPKKAEMLMRSFIDDVFDRHSTSAAAAMASAILKKEL